MIAKVVRGYRPGGLIAYLFGPGRHEEHRNPRVVASWDGAPWLHQPERLASVVLDGEVLPAGEFDLDLRQLIATMQDPAKRAGLPLNGPPAISPTWAQVLRAGGPLPRDAPPWLAMYRYDARAGAVVLRPGYVWHCPVRLHTDDPVLSDEQWQRIAHRLMTAAGIHQAGCRWIAVRHAEDHIHLVAVLVDERTGRRVHPYRDYPKLRATCQQLERELGLVRTASADKTAAPAPTRAEKAKAERLHRRCTPREELRRLVAQCAAIASDGEQFLDLLRRDGLNPQTVLDNSGRVRGYTVALPGDRTADGTPVRYAGSALAPDLTWPKLAARWHTAPAPQPLQRNDHGRVTPTQRHAVLEQTAKLVERATAVVRDRDEHPGGIAHAAGEVLATLSRGTQGSSTGSLTEIAGRYDRAARTPHHVLPANMGWVARELRHAARQLGAIGVLTGRGDEKLATITLLLALASLVAEIAAWHQQHDRLHQAAAARSAANALPALATSYGQRHRPMDRPVQPPAAARHSLPALPRHTPGHPLPRPWSRGPG